MEKLEIAKEYVRAVARGHSSNLLLTGKQGTGKSFLVKQVLEEEKSNYVIVTSSVSPMELYKILWNHSAKDKNWEGWYNGSIDTLIARLEEQLITLKAWKEDLDSGFYDDGDSEVCTEYKRKREKEISSAIKKIEEALG